MSLDIPIKNGVAIIGNRSYPVEVLDGHDEYMETTRLLPEALFVVPWARLKKIRKDKTTDIVIMPEVIMTLATRLADMRDKYMAGSVAMLKLAEVIHQNIGSAIQLLDTLKLNYVLAPPAICLFKEGAKLNSQFVSKEEVHLTEIEQKTFAKWDNDLDKITKPLRGKVPSRRISDALDAFGVKRDSWISEDDRMVPYVDGSRNDSDQEDDQEGSGEEDEESVHGSEDENEESENED